MLKYNTKANTARSAKRTFSFGYFCFWLAVIVFISYVLFVACAGVIAPKAPDDASISSISNSTECTSMLCAVQPSRYLKGASTESTVRRAASSEKRRIPPEPMTIFVPPLSSGEKPEAMPIFIM